MSLKNDARSMMEKAGVPVLPGFSADSLSYEQIVKKCENIGFPLIINASAGSGKTHNLVFQYLPQLLDTLQKESL